MFKRLFPLLILIFFLAGCAPPESRAGSWHASTEYGDFTVYVNQEGTAVTSMDYDFECGGVTASADSVPFKASSKSIDGRKLTISITYSFIKMLNIEGSFSLDGKRLSGTATFMPQEISGGCTADFTSKR